ncbi:MAG: mechanosensitive ion channel family protein [Kiritimatiellae bacterium]|nr:mechanosensitive ion channel family protein [Kiritimatiellia bacterium]
MTNDVIAATNMVAVTQQVSSAVAKEIDHTKEIYQKATDWLSTNGIPYLFNLLLALVILIVGALAIKLIVHLTRKTLEKTKKVNTLLENFISSVVHKGCWALLLIIVLQKVGVNIAPLIAGLGVTGFILGFAFQESLGNLASGMMIAINHPFAIGDFVSVGGIEGIVKELNMMATTLATGDNKKVVVPNKSVWGSPITNFSALPTRRVDITVGIDYGQDIAKAREVILEALTSCPLVLSDPAPTIEVVKFDDSSVNFCVRPWANNADYWKVYFACHEAIKRNFDRNYIKIPFRHLDVHLVNDAYSIDK